MTTRYMSVSDIAHHTNVQVPTISGYIRKGMLPAPAVIIGEGKHATRGWTREQIDEWVRNRPGPGNRTVH